MHLKTTPSVMLAAVGAAAILSACAGPGFQAATAPATCSAASLPVPAAGDGLLQTSGRPAEQQPRGAWWLVFNDPALTALVEQAGAVNAHLTVAVARVVASRAISAELPELDLASSGDGALPRQPGSFAASYEADLLRRVAADAAAPRIDAGAVLRDYRSLLLALQADVAQYYFQLKIIDADSAVLAATEQASDSVAALRRRAGIERAMAILLGEPARRFRFVPAPLGSEPEPPTASIPAAPPPNLLERRPDISAAQSAMQASPFPSINPDAAARYRNSVLLALAEVENKLAAIRMLDGRARLSDDDLRAAQRSERLARSRHLDGPSGDAARHDARRHLAAAERTVRRLRGERALATLSLIRSLGGGWDAGASP
ncbi:hypothetical protein [Rugamonas sp.]|uniref:hypothetical protein n=1 Tax=Rugamonas sp. TaxID=1926287 RepID=UPI0025D5E2B0|nr:hypothetical protein [Rugamonas sp.]